MKRVITKQITSSVGLLSFYGENVFSVRLNDVPRGDNLNNLINKLDYLKEISIPNALDCTSSIISTKLDLFFVRLPLKNDRGILIREMKDLYKINKLKGDPFSSIHLSVLDKDKSFLKSYPHSSVYSRDKDLFHLTFNFSLIPTIEGANVSSGYVRETSGYFPSELWFTGVGEDIF